MCCSSKKIIKRQVFDIPAPQIIVTEDTEDRVAVKESPECKT
ncbi:hypothetical protein [Trichormus azollae]